MAAHVIVLPDFLTHRLEGHFHHDLGQDVGRDGELGMTPDQRIDPPGNDIPQVGLFSGDHGVDVSGPKRGKPTESQSGKLVFCRALVPRKLHAAFLASVGALSTQQGEACIR